MEPRKKYPKNNFNKNRDYLSDTPSNSSSSVSSLTDHQFQKREGPFSKQNETEGHVQQVNKKRTTETQSLESSRGDKSNGHNTNETE